MMTFADYVRLRAQLALHEGFRAEEYTDSVGKRTIGYGYNVTDRGTAAIEKVTGRPYDGTITPTEATILLERDIVATEAEARGAFPWLKELTPVRQRVVLDMAFNMGVPVLKTFRQTLLALRDREYVLAARRMLQSKWARQTKGRAVRLARMMETGADAPVS